MEMTKAFYIVKTREDWYRLHLTSTHYCLGGGLDLQPLLNTVARLTKKYRTESRLLKGLSMTEDKGLISEKTKDLYEEDYNSLSQSFEDLVKTTVKKALDEVKFDTPFHRAMKRTMTLKKTTRTMTTEHCVKDTTKRPKALVARSPKTKKW